MHIKTILDTHVPPHLRSNIAKPVLDVFDRLKQQWQEHSKVINGGLEFGSPTAGPVNIKGTWKTATTPGTPGTDFTITHNLGHSVVNHNPTTKSAACDVYLSPTANADPEHTVILRATAAGVDLTFFLY